MIIEASILKKHLDAISVGKEIPSVKFDSNFSTKALNDSASILVSAPKLNGDPIAPFALADLDDFIKTIKSFTGNVSITFDGTMLKIQGILAKTEDEISLNWVTVEVVGSMISNDKYDAVVSNHKKTLSSTYTLDVQKLKSLLVLLSTYEADSVAFEYNNDVLSCTPVGDFGHYTSLPIGRLVEFKKDTVISLHVKTKNFIKILNVLLSIAKDTSENDVILLEISDSKIWFKIPTLGYSYFLVGQV